MNLQLVPRSVVATRNPHLYPGSQRVGSCIQILRPTYECGAAVYAGTGFADLDGEPFKAYYCPSCAATYGVF